MLSNKKLFESGNKSYLLIYISFKSLIECITLNHHELNVKQKMNPIEKKKKCPIIFSTTYHQDFIPLELIGCDNQEQTDRVESYFKAKYSTQ